MTVRNKRTVTSTLAVAIAAAFAGLMGASPAEAACASFWGVGNSAQCQSEVGSFAIVTDDTGSATAVGIGGAISVGGGTAISDGLFTAALASGANTNATALGTGSLAQDVANDQNTGSEATSEGWFNRALNYGNGNIARAVSGLQPTLDLETGNIDIGNNTALNVGNGNGAGAGAVLPGLPGGFSNGVYQFGEREPRCGHWRAVEPDPSRRRQRHLANEGHASGTEYCCRAVHHEQRVWQSERVQRGGEHQRGAHGRR